MSRDLDLAKGSFFAARQAILRSTQNLGAASAYPLDRVAEPGVYSNTRPAPAKRDAEIDNDSNEVSRMASSLASSEITHLLQAWKDGDPRALDRLAPRIYRDLKRLAAGYLRRERAGHTLQATALVHEAFLRLYRQQRIDWRNRGQFFALSATLMRRILIDHARHRGVAQRHGLSPRPETGELEPAVEVAIDLIALDHALSQLGRMAPHLARVVELRFFAGLGIDEAAAVLGVSDRTVKRRWRAARLWLFRALSEGEGHAA